jgi:hypothetical protein
MPSSGRTWTSGSLANGTGSLKILRLFVRDSSCLHEIAVEEYRGVAQQGWSGGVELKYLLSAVM